MNLSSRDYVDALYEQYLQDPSSVPVEWRNYFASFPDTLTAASSNAQGNPVASGAGTVTAESSGRTVVASEAALSRPGSHMSLAQLQDRVDQLIRGFRVRGHMAARIDPLGLPRPEQRELIPESYGLLPSDMDKLFSTRTIDGENVRPLGEIVQQMRNTYCRYIGAQFMHIDDYDVRDWLQKRMEGTENRLELSRETQIRILTRLTDAVIFEEFVRRKFVGAKTFSLEGAESLIPLLDLALEKAGDQGIQEVVIGMA
jgi:2-oxoglutarate dehydrogenase E1 component